MHDDIATTTGNSAKSDSPDITGLGHDAHQIDTASGIWQRLEQVDQVSA